MKCLEQGKQEAFQQLFETFHKALCFFAARIVRDHLEAEDIVQDVFLSFWKMDRGGFPNVKTIKTFLYNSVQHRCLNYLRDLEIRDRNYKNLGREELMKTIFCQQIRADVVAELFGAIDELPDRCKEIFKRSYVDGQRIGKLPKS
ncbi:MAG: sigma-70 family RNA polymerase sigma factor [Butyricimonas faecalis]